ncbi:MAG: hypothetical protein K2Y29_16400 [Beijerinckiaceae bacterium]|nr:hypothetical protein [Beijerinckiaceae bacterium]
MIAALTLKAAWAFVKAHWRGFAIGGAVLAVIAYHNVQVYRAYYAGRDAVLAEQKAEAQRRSKNAQTADDAARDCARDPSCRLRDDGHRRD